MLGMGKKRLERSLRVTFLGLLVNAALAAGKIAAGVIGHSHALVADGVESAGPATFESGEIESLLCACARFVANVQTAATTKTRDRRHIRKARVRLNVIGSEPRTWATTRADLAGAECGRKLGRRPAKT